jgi:uncharacterized protein
MRESVPEPGATAFLTAQWRNIAILNYQGSPALLTPLLPNGIELDLRNGQAFLSVVGLLFERVRVHGIPLPFYRRFEQVNLRFYVRRRVQGDWRRGVVFVKEFVPYRSMAAAARLLYSQSYEFARMRCRIETGNAEFRGQPLGCPDGRTASTTVEYSWWHSHRWNRLGVSATGPSEVPAVGSLEEFITERHWGYAETSPRGFMEFQVRRPAWLVCAADGWLDCDSSKVYGDAFAGILSSKPVSAFVAAGSAVALSRPVAYSS